MTPIHQVELAEPIQGFHVTGGATRCLLILRWHGRVVGRLEVRVRNDVVDGNELRQAIAQAPSSDAVDVWLDEVIAAPRPAHFSTMAAVSDTTVVICTRERPDDLARTLAAISLLTPAPREIIVVDNAPDTDATRAIVERHGRARYVIEERRGLDAARNRGLREARGAFVAMSDDDAMPESDWLEGLIRNFEDPSVVVATGLTLPLELQTEGQELFESHCSFVRGFRRRVFDGQRDNPLAVGPCGAGANMAVRRHTVLDLGGFDERLDGGMPTRSGGDHDLFVRVLLAGHRIVYDPAAVSWHRHRRTRNEVFDTVFGYGVGVYAMWTGLLVERRQLGVFRLAWQWLRHSQLKNLLSRDDEVARAIAWHELNGCLQGPRRWFAARRLHRALANR